MVTVNPDVFALKTVEVGEISAASDCARSVACGGEERVDGVGENKDALGDEGDGAVAAILVGCARNRRISAATRAASIAST